MKGICYGITPILDRSADYRAKRSHSCMIYSPLGLKHIRISIKCCRFINFDIKLLM